MRVPLLYNSVRWLDPLRMYHFPSHSLSSFYHQTLLAHFTALHASKRRHTAGTRSFLVNLRSSQNTKAPIGTPSEVWEVGRVNLNISQSFVHASVIGGTYSTYSNLSEGTSPYDS
jgi:hypothetical protein